MDKLFLDSLTVTNGTNGQFALADLGGGREGCTPPLGVQILSISCSFRENLACSRPPWRVHAPPRENPGSATGLGRGMGGGGAPAYINL